MGARSLSARRLREAAGMTVGELSAEAGKVIVTGMSIPEVVRIYRRVVAYREIVGDDDDMFNPCDEENGTESQTARQFFVSVACGRSYTSEDDADRFWRKLVGAKNLHLIRRAEFVTAFARQVVGFFETIGQHDTGYLKLVEAGRL